MSQNFEENVDINVNDTFDRDLEMLRYFQEEFMFRQQHYWDILIKSFVLSIVISILPITSEVLGVVINGVSENVQRCFPILGFIVAFLSFFVLRDEARKIKAVNEAKYRINRQLMHEKYQYNFYNDTIGKIDTGSAEDEDGKKKRLKWMAFKMPYVILFAESLISLAVLWILR